MSDEDLVPFRVSVPEADVSDLRDRLARTRWPAPLPGDGWDTGVPLGWLRDMVEYWRDGFDWRAVEARVNAFDQVTTVVDGQPVHALHVRSPHPEALPLVLTHGWPGSVLEFLDILGPLTDPPAHGGAAADAFHVVAPALPGFGFSSPVTDPGWTRTRTARAWVELMSRFGYDRFAAQGGDIGAGVSVEIGRVAPDRVVGIHVNGGPDVPIGLPEDEVSRLTPLEQDRIRRIGEFMRHEFGYIAVQSTRPQLVGAALTDSPVGQLAWIMDKYRAWTHPADALPDEILGRDTLLAQASLYWFTRTAGSSAYVGYAQGEWGRTPANSGIPTAALVLAHDMAVRAHSEKANTITRWTDVDRGGHFAALEEPDLLVSDVREFFRDLR
jgi:pimeloyl-ACP methyl ester carboxylesterase